MQFFKKLFAFYVESNLHVSIAGASFTAVSLLYLEGKIEGLYPLFVFFSTLLGYHFIRIVDKYEYGEESIGNFLSELSIEIISLLVISFFGILYVGSRIGMSQMWILIPAVLTTFFYAVPILKYKGQKVTLRTYPRLKLLSIAFTWSIVTVLFPLQEYLGEKVLWLLALQRFLLILVLVIPFDIRDLKVDALSLQTLPQQIGIKRTKAFAAFFLLLFIGISFIRISNAVHLVIIDACIALISFYFLFRANINQSKYFASFWVEAVPIFWMGFVGLYFLMT